MLRLEPWYRDKEFYRGLLGVILGALVRLIDMVITLEIIIFYLRYRGVIG